jgi:hypothetical protein
MNDISRNCKNCTRHTVQQIIGFVPVASVNNSLADSDQWVKASVCCACGAYNVIEVDDSDVRRADERYLDLMVKTGQMTREEAKDILGIN